MVTAPIVLLIAVATSPDAGAIANEAAAACRLALPAGATTEVRVVPATPDAAAIDADARAIGATATVLVTWRDDALLVSDVLVSVASADGPGPRASRTVVFSARDLPAERGRALGLVVASILDEAWGIDHVVATPAPGARPPKIGLEDAEVPPGLTVTRAAERREIPLWALEANVITAVDEQEDFDDTIGGMIALRRSLGTGWALRAGLGLRVADIDGANATTRTTLGALGVAWSSDGLPRARGFGFGARADLLGVREAVQRNDGDDGHFEGHWSAGADLLGQLAFGLSGGTSLLLGGGLEGFLSGLSVTEPARPPVAIPRGRLICELGVLARF